MGHLLTFVSLAQGAMYTKKPAIARIGARNACDRVSLIHQQNIVSLIIQAKRMEAQSGSLVQWLNSSFVMRAGQRFEIALGSPLFEDLQVKRKNQETSKVLYRLP
jgi:hypothetical protein